MGYTTQFCGQNMKWWMDFSEHFIVYVLKDADFEHNIGILRKPKKITENQKKLQKTK